MSSALTSSTLRSSASTTRVAVMDYGMGNLRSVANAVHKVAPQALVTISQNPEEILAADRVIFPGVGAMRDCMAEIKRVGFDDVIVELTKSKPLLAICVGMQALLSHSEENHGVECLNYFAGKVKLFPAAEDEQGIMLKVPHMGWNTVNQITPHPLWRNIADGSRFYFVHSYFVEPEDQALVAASSGYGETFVAALARDNVFATQFHPEKSHTNGLQLLANFVDWDGQS